MAKVKVSEWLVNDWFKGLSIAEKCVVLNMPFDKIKARKDRGYFNSILNKTEDKWSRTSLVDKTDMYNDYFE